MLPSILLLSIVSTVNSDSFSDGWRPVPRERVFNLRNFIKTERNGNLPAVLNPALADTFFNKQTTTNGRAYTQNVYPKDIVDERKDEISIVAEKEALSESFLNTEIPVKLKTISRKAKTISDYGYKADGNMINDEHKTEEDNELFEKSIDKYGNSYSVTEDNIDITADQTNEGYNYAPVKEETKNSLTDKFLKILSNYNIRSSDKLPNYALSLRPNSRHSSSDKYMYVHVPVKVPVSYNSPNHLLVDPLLAVFLSNFGYYLPGLYGISANYRNLYGYAAANNIHNNQPIGSYKIYSDTDSYQ